MKYIELACRLTLPVICLVIVVWVSLTGPTQPKVNWRKVAEDVPYNWRECGGWSKDGVVRFHTPKTKNLMLSDIEKICGKPIDKFTLVKWENEETSDRPEVLTFHVYPKFILMESDFAAQPHSVAFIGLIE